MYSAKKILVMILFLVTIFTSSTCLAAGIFSSEAKRDFTALGTEPFWSLNIFTDDTAIFSTPEGSIGFVYSAPDIKGREYHYDLKNKVLSGVEITIHVTITEKETADSMAGRIYPYSAKINLAGQTYEGVAYINKESIKGKKNI